MSSSSSHLKLTDVLVRAGAGAGKTTELTQRVLSLADTSYSAGKVFPKVVVTTFTRKATQELKERLLKKVLDEDKKELLPFLQSSRHLHISTIHGVLGLLLSQYGSSLGLSPEFKFISGRQDSVLRKKILRKLLKEDENFRKTFADFQEFIGANALVSAWIQWGESQIQNPSSGCVSVDTLENMAQEKLSEFRWLVSETLAEIESSSSDEAWLKWGGDLKNLLSDLHLPRLQRDRENFNKPKKKKDTSEILNEKAELLLEAWDELLEWPFQEEAWEKHHQMAQDFCSSAKLFFENYLNEKIETGHLMMSDLETFSLLLLQRSPESVRLFSESWDYWFIDEYQDTSPVQVKLLKALVGDRKSFVVGDPQQSIYLFRGARSEVFHEREKEVRALGGETLQKITNYRSTPELLSFFNRFFPRINAIFQPMDPKAVSQRSDGPVAHYFLAESEEQAVLYRIQELIAAGVFPEDICVLSRNNKDLESLALAGGSWGIPLHLHTAGKFFERREVQDALSFLKFLVNPHDNLRFLELARSPWFKISDEELVSISKYEKGSHWLGALQTLSTEPVKRLERILDQSKQVGVLQAWTQALINSGMIDFSYKIDPTGRREANLWKLVHRLHQEERRPGFHLIHFLENFDESQISIEEASEGDATPVVEPQRVNLMTIHASKGLQFSHVILLGFGKYRSRTQTNFFSFDEDSGIWTLALHPPEEAKLKLSLWGKRIAKAYAQREQEEYDRLLYVALTRAKETVTMITSRVDKGSWADRWPYQREEGEFLNEDFLLRVKTENYELKAPVADEIWSPELRPPFLERTVASRELLSVTEALEKIRKSGGYAEANQITPSLEPMKKAFQGTDIHGFLESLKYFPERISEKPSNEVKAQALHFIKNWNQGALLEVIEKGHVEWGFGCRFGSSLIQGQVDLWGPYKDEIWIVDYKTGSPFFKDKALSQLKIYAWALHKTKKIDEFKKIQLVIVYPLAETAHIEEAPPLADIEKDLACISSVIR